MVIYGFSQVVGKRKDDLLSCPLSDEPWNTDQRHQDKVPPQRGMHSSVWLSQICASWHSIDFIQGRRRIRMKPLATELSPPAEEDKSHSALLLEIPF